MAQILNWNMKSTHQVWKPISHLIKKEWHVNTLMQQNAFKKKIKITYNNMKYKDNQCAMDAKNYKHIIDIKMS